ncbi:Metallo-dependent phosphatase [Armillaria novae-zelandiae]|uniref:Metallo-dependent phosphatase n=1 Tax=Armillaria novae-zelandiae TaxID=153914 RepID=A0AA39NY62_9AGAR|nr:Metallo-dependent phosphatase [Armillaria novae-zelandiae]
MSSYSTSSDAYFTMLFMVTIVSLGQLVCAAPTAAVKYDQASLGNVRTTGNLNPYPDKPRITFRPDGTFKITVFSDLHFGEGPDTIWGPEQDSNSTRLMRKVLPEEKPDFAVINGDLITGENTFRENSTTLVDRINHDNQVNITHLEEIIRERQVSSFSYTRCAPPGVGGEGGPGNYWVPVYANEEGQHPVLILWFFDSRGGFSPGKNSTAVPDWVDSSVAEWIESETASMEDEWGPAESRGALAFVHIPPHVVQSLQSTLNHTSNPGLNADTLGQGSTQATTQDSDTGKDGPFWNALNKYIKNLHAVISGHDHGNEWCSRETAQNVIFCFDKHSGYRCMPDQSFGELIMLQIWWLRRILVGLWYSQSGIHVNDS